jgi:hypothetical protein
VVGEGLGVGDREGDGEGEGPGVAEEVGEGDPEGGGDAAADTTWLYRPHMPAPLLNCCPLAIFM